MRVPRVYLNQPLSLNRDKADALEITLSADAAHYLTRVLRMQAGRLLRVFNGEDGEFEARIVEASKKSTRISLLAEVDNNGESTLDTLLAIGISKGDRFDYALQKATELGVTSIQPLLTENGDVKLAADRLEKKLAHWQQVVISACEQCQRIAPPRVLKPLALPEFLETFEPRDLNFVLHHRDSQGLPNNLASKSCAILIGPEGGLSGEEIAYATQKGYQPLTLGPRVLRTETAPVVALLLIQSLWGDI